MGAGRLLLAWRYAPAYYDNRIEVVSPPKTFQDNELPNVDMRDFISPGKNTTARTNIVRERFNLRIGVEFDVGRFSRDLNSDHFTNNAEFLFRVLFVSGQGVPVEIPNQIVNRHLNRLSGQTIILTLAF
jgi:hypothetical protein